MAKKGELMTDGMIAALMTAMPKLKRDIRKLQYERAVYSLYSEFRMREGYSAEDARTLAIDEMRQLQRLLREKS